MRDCQPQPGSVPELPGIQRSGRGSWNAYNITVFVPGERPATRTPPEDGCIPDAELPDWIGETTLSNRPWPAVALCIGLALAATTAADTRALEGDWACPAEMQLAAIGQNQLNLQVDTRSRLDSDGRYQSEGDAVVQFGAWPLTLIATSEGQWRREQQHLTVTVEALELAPGSASGVELQQYLIRQITPLIPDLPHTEVARIVTESPGQLVLEDAFGEQHTCRRL